MAEKSTVFLRIIAENQAEATRAAELLQVVAGGPNKEAFIGISPAREGRKGQWLAYGTFTFPAPSDATQKENKA